MAGSATFTNSNLALTIWADNPITPNKDGLNNGEEFILKYWNGSENEIIVQNWSEGNSIFEKDKLAVVGAISDIKSLDDFNLQAFPNPADNEISVSFDLIIDGKVQIFLFDQIGQKVSQGSNSFAKGNNKILIDVSHLSQGSYFLSILSGNYRETIPLKILR